MKTARFEYKCRRCGEIELNPHTAEKNALIIMLSGIFGYPLPKNMKSFSGQEPRLFNIHNCKDGGMGVSDLLGYNVIGS